MITYDKETPRLDLGRVLTEYYEDGFKDFIGFDVLPKRNVGREEGWYPVLGKKTSLERVANTQRERGTTYKRINLDVDQDSYKTVNNGIEAVVTDEDQYDNRTDFDTEVLIGKKAQRMIMLNHEVRVAGKIFDTAAFTGTPYFKDYKATPWSTAATDIFLQIAYAKKKVHDNSGRIADTLTLGYDAYCNLIANDDVKARFPGAPIITEKMLFDSLGSLFGLKYINVGSAIYDSTAEGATFSGSNVWSTKYASVHVSGDGLANAGIGNTVNWDIVGNGEISVETYRDPTVKSNIIRVEQYTQEKIVNKDMGFLLQIEVA